MSDAGRAAREKRNPFRFERECLYVDKNNLTDLTMDARAATLAGYTHAEVKTNFADRLAALGEANGLTSAGAFDRVVQMYGVYKFPHEVYVAEVKLDRTAQEAIDQIKANGYAERCRASGRRVTLLGINFSSKRREIDGVLAEEA